MKDVKPAISDAAGPTLPVLAPMLMIVFWMLLGGAAGIKIMQSIWRFLGVEGGELTIAVPVGGAVGALAGALLGFVNNPRLLVLLMAVFAGASAGGVAGQIVWGDIGAIGGQVAGSLIGGITWAIWLLIGARSSQNVEVTTETCQQAGHEPEADRGVQEECLGCLEAKHTFKTAQDGFK